MLAELRNAVGLLPWLIDHYTWTGVDIDYDTPRVERVWTRLDAYRVNLHVIHCCENALYHPHPWPSAALIVDGSYEMCIGYGTVDSEPPVAATVVISPGSTYEMADKDGWHSVRPLTSTVLSVMVTGAPWFGRRSPGNGTAKPLSDDRKREILTMFRAKEVR